MSEPVTAIAPQSFVNMFFEQEKLPFELGWHPPTVQINFATLVATVAQILVFADDEQLEVTEITESMSFAPIAFACLTHCPGNLKLAFGGLSTDFPLDLGPDLPISI
jgi:hypothetical protein